MTHLDSSNLLRGALATLAATCGLLAGPSVAQEEAKLLGSTAGAVDSFGFQLSLSGDTAVIGAPGDDDLGDHAGAVYVFRRSGTTWTEEAKIVAPDGSAGDSFGGACAIDGNLLAVGCIGDDDQGADSGSVYVFERSGTTWGFQAKLLPSDGTTGRQFGRGLDLDGDTILAGAPFDSSLQAGAGSAYAFTRLGPLWQEAKIPHPEPGADHHFGLALGLSGDTAVLGVPDESSLAHLAGAAYVFVRSGAAWNLQAKLTAADGAANDAFGLDVDAFGERVVVGALGDDDPAQNAGAAYVFVRFAGVWHQEAKLLPTALSSSQEFGFAVAMEADAVLVGAPRDDYVFPDSGAAQLFTRDSFATWTRVGELVASDAEAHDRFGCAVAVSGEVLLLGAEDEDEGGTDTGAAYAFVRSPAPGAPGQPLCFGDGSGTACPCGNDSTLAFRGCRHSGGEGMSLQGRGSTSIAADDLVLSATSCPVWNAGIFYCGRTSLDPGVPLFGGLQCAGGSVRRFQGILQTNGIAEDTGFVAQDPSGTYFLAGVTYFFQFWTRDVNTGTNPCGAVSTLSPAYAVTMTP